MKSNKNTRHAIQAMLLFIFVVVGACLMPVNGPLAAPDQPDGMEAGDVLEHLNIAIDWYRRLTSMDTGAGSSGDILYLQEARTQALQALHLAFQSAREEAIAIQRQGSPVSDEAGAQQDTGEQRMARVKARVKARIVETRVRIDALNRRIKTTRGKKLQELIGQRDALQRALDLDKTLQEGLNKMAGFMETAENAGLLGRINMLKTSVPELARSGQAKPPAEKPAKAGTTTYSSGLIGQASLLLRQLGDVRAIDQLLSETARLRAAAERVQAPLRNYLRSTLKDGRQAAGGQGTVASVSPKKLDAIRSQFKQVMEASLPLRQEMVLLDQVRGNLLEWRKSVQREYVAVLRSLIVHVIVMLGALLLVFVFSESWRRTTYRYVQEARRRRQVLLLRRFVTGFLMAVVIVLGFVSEFHSLATFAGFLTAGIAVALQTVILSVAAYFFLIGRYGVRVGDRVTVGGVTGDVLDIGLVRMHLLELAGTGVNLFPTGRVVVFSNSVLLQASPLFKQIPGTSYTWHEATVRLAQGADQALIEKKLLKAVNRAFDEHRSEIERQHGVVERIVESEMPAPEPAGEFRFTDSGLEFVVRYPVDIRSAQEIDDEVVKKLTEVIEAEPGVKAAVTAPPKLRALIRG